MQLFQVGYKNVATLLQKFSYNLSHFSTIGPNGSKNCQEYNSSCISTWAWYGAARLQTVLGPEFSARLDNRAGRVRVHDVATLMPGYQFLHSWLSGSALFDQTAK